MSDDIAVTAEEDEAFEALARRNDELQREKLDRLEELQHQEWQIDKLRDSLSELRSAVGRYIDETNMRADYGKHLTTTDEELVDAYDRSGRW